MGKKSTGQGKKRNFNDTMASSMASSEERAHIVRKQMKVKLMDRVYERELKALKSLRSVPGELEGKEKLPRPLIGDGLYSHEEVKKYLEARLDLAGSLLESEKAEDACRHYSAIVKMDPADSLKVKPTFLKALLELGALENAKEFLDANSTKVGANEHALFMWSSAVLEYVLWAVLEDEDGSEEKANKVRLTAPGQL